MNNEWTNIEKSNPFDLGKILLELKNYKDLIVLFFKRDIKASYQQTVLGPIWLLMQPVLTSIVFTVVFGNIAKIPTPAGISPFAFYLLGLAFWGLFADSFNRTSSTFVANASVFGKVYFPRLTVPASIILSSFFRFSIQFVLFLVVFTIGFLFQGYMPHINATILLIPIYLILIALFALGLGLIASALTTKYRDLTMLLGFGIQLMMYATPIAYPFFTIRFDSIFYKILLLNPLTGIIEASKYAFISSGLFSPKLLIADSLVILAVLLFGIYVFSRVERRFMDTV